MSVGHCLLALIRAQLSDHPLQPDEISTFQKFSAEEWTELLNMSMKQNVQAIIYETLKQNPDISMPGFVMNIFKQKAYSAPMQYYQKIAALRQILKYLKEKNINYYVLKGVGLSTMYPKEEMRSFGDIDLYIPKQDDVEKTHLIFTKLGCDVEKSFADHHIVYIYRTTNVVCEVEVHWKMTADFNNGVLDEKLESIYRQLDGDQYMTVKPMQLEVHILPPTYNALHLLAHMLQHLMRAGFGLKLFCDWTVFWQKHGKDVDSEQFLEWIKDLHIENFLYVVTTVCCKYFGLSRECCTWINENNMNEELADALLHDVFGGGEHGKYDSARTLIMSRKPTLKTYVMELHRQMKRRFKKCRNIVFLWPILWLLTGIIFVYNNMNLRNVSTKKILDTNKERNKLIQRLDIFEEK